MQKKTNAGIARSGIGVVNRNWTIAGQDYHLMALQESVFAFEVICDPGQSVPMHIHSDQDEFILVQSGQLRVNLDERAIEARPGDLVRMPRGLPHRYENCSEGTVKALFWVSPALDLADLFSAIDGLAEPSEIIRISKEYGIKVVPLAA